MGIRPRTVKYVVNAILTLGCSLFLWSCNNVTSNQLPPGTSVRVDPENITWTIANTGGVCNFNPDFYQDQTITVMVVNDSGTFIPDAPLSFTLDLAANTFSGVPVMALYNDVNNNGVVDGPNELVSDNTSGAYTDFTDKVNGSKQVIVRVNLSCTYKGTLYVLSDGFMGTTTIEVDEEAL